MSISNARFPVLLLLLCLTAACAPSESSSDAQLAAPPEPAAPEVSAGPSPSDIATNIDASRSELRSETRSGRMGEIDRTETRYYVGSNLVLVEERVGAPGQRPSESAYYFDDDRLVFFRGRGTRTIFVPGSEGTRERYEIELGFDLDGNVVDSVKIINGEPAPLEPFDFETPKARARSLTGEPLVQ